VRTFAAGYQLENGRYVVESLLGGGGMGNVYKAKDTRLNRVVALKVLHADLVSHPTARRRMTREAEALARVTHPNVVQIFDVFDHPPHLILVLDLIDGHELGVNLESGMAEDKALALMTQILSGMEAIHEANLVHRDIKPANILVSNKGKPMITDLGVAHDSTQRGQTKMGARLGTVEYMSPEQVQGTNVDVRSDIYSLGIVLFEMLAGSLPFKGNTDFDFMTAHVSHEPNLALLTGKASTHITAVITKALAKKPDDRWATAAEMNKALHDPKLTANVRESAAQAPAKEPAIAKPIESPALPAAPLKEQDSYDAPIVQRNMTPIVVGALVVFFVLVIALIAVPSFVKYMRRAKTTEAIDQLDKIYKASSHYYASPRVEKYTGAKIECQFPYSQGMTPDVTAKKCCGGIYDIDGDDRCDVNISRWTTDTWSALNFQMNDQHYFGYEYTSSGTITNAKFTAAAYADLDCDGILSTFERYGYGDASASHAECSMRGSSAFYKNNETE
jgi:serine/threonine protein kinase